MKSGPAAIRANTSRAADKWSHAKLGDVLELQRRWFVPKADETYTEIGVRSFGNGIFHKAPITGLELGNKRVLRIEPGDLILSNVFAWEGAVGVAGESEAGKIGSHRFITLTPRDSRCDVRFLRLFFRTEAGLELLGRASPGSAGRNRTLGIERFLEEVIPLPQLSEQKVLADRVERLIAKITRARDLRTLAMVECVALFKASLNDLSRHFTSFGPLGDFLTDQPRNGWSAPCDNADSGTPVLTLSAVTGCRYDGSAHKRTSLPTDPNAHYWLAPGDLLITRSNTPDLVGHIAMYDGTPFPCIYPDLVMRFRSDPQKADRQFVWLWLQTPLIRAFITRHAKGTSPTMKKISQGTVASIPFPLGTAVKEQKRIVERLLCKQEQLDRLHRLQDDTEKELDALTSSVLNRLMPART